MDLASDVRNVDLHTGGCLLRSGLGSLRRREQGPNLHREGRPAWRAVGPGGAGWPPGSATKFFLPTACFVSEITGVTCS